MHPMGFTLRRQPTTPRPGVLGLRPSQKAQELPSTPVCRAFSGGRPGGLVISSEVTYLRKWRSGM